MPSGDGGSAVRSASAGKREVVGSACKVLRTARQHAVLRRSQPVQMRKARLKSPGFGKPHRPRWQRRAGRPARDRTGPGGSTPAAASSIQPATVRPSSWNSRCNERSDMWWAAATMAGERPSSPRCCWMKAWTVVSRACGGPRGVSHSRASSSCASRVASTSMAAVDRRTASPGLQWSILRASWSRNCDVTSPRPAPPENGTAASCLSWFRDMAAGPAET